MLRLKSRLGDLGDFSLLLTSKGAEDADKFTSQNITGVKVQWEPGQEFKNLRDDAEFNLVASRYHNGKFYIFSNINGHGLQVYISDSAKGPWTHHKVNGDIQIVDGGILIG